MQMPGAEAAAYRGALAGNKLGGTPAFLQGDELPIPEPWHLLLQLDSTQVLFWINFGSAGIGYAFINQAGTEGRFLWQCCWISAAGRHGSGDTRAGLVNRTLST